MKVKRYLLKIKLDEIDPEIWRHFVVPAYITLDRLHDIIQIVMGWTDSHLYEFIIGKKRFTEFPESKEDGFESGKYRLGDLIKLKGRTFDYRYDFGDNWVHEVTIEDNRYANPDLQSEVECLDGAKACPPEDIGGVLGYGEFCEAMKDSSHEAHEGVLEWNGGPYDSEEFSIEDINEELSIYLRWSRERYLPWREEPPA
ncbi:MAG: plasmid pRiA4b ORF-3 family protein [Desulfobacterales bacterium]|jgi:hypothetical protein|nr:plasmid pRiA4b ORF-3 family protein [Desulfobacterales bacterium]